MRASLALTLAAALAAGCSASNPAPDRWRRTTKQAAQSPQGCWMSVTLRDGSVHQGELLAVEDRLLYVGAGGRLRPIELVDVREATVVAFTAETGGMSTWTALGLLSSLSHGFLLVFSVPTWALTWGISSRAFSDDGYLEYEVGSDGIAVLKGFRKWARYPQGLPPSITSPRRDGPPGSTAPGANMEPP